MTSSLRAAAALLLLALAGGIAPEPSEAAGPFQFHAITPCRLADTRNPNGPTGGPALVSNTNRTFPVQGQCGVPVGAKAATLNLTITQPTGAGHLIVFPGGGQAPGVSTLNFVPGEPALANGAIVPLGTTVGSDLATRPFVTNNGTVHVIIDITGYFQ
jgi:serine protease